MNNESKKTVLRISSDQSITNDVFEERARQFDFCPLRASSVGQAIGFIGNLDDAPDFISIDQDIADDFGERFRDLGSALMIVVESNFDRPDTKLLLTLRRPVARNQAKGYKNIGVTGVIPHADCFDRYLNQRAYEEILSGNEFWPRECLYQLPKQETKESRTDVELTDRQQEVQKLLCERGLSNKGIARQLNISESTVKIHVSAILKRYGVRNRTQLALAVNNGARL